jgi:ABC-2 type transport system permease protein
MDFEALAQTGTRTGFDVVPMMFFGMGQIDPSKRQSTKRSYALAARIRGPLPEPPVAEEESEGEEEETEKPDESGELDVILAADIDMIHDAFFSLRAQGTGPEAQFELTPDNVTFVLNALDSLAGDDRFIEIRKRRAKHRTLTTIERKTKASLLEKSDEAEAAQKKFDEVVKQEEEKLQKELDDLKERWAAENMSELDVLQQIGMKQREGQQRLEAQKKRLQADLDRTRNRVDTEMTLEIERVQDTYKLWAVLLPPILPLLIAVFVFMARRLQEKEGVSRSRLR